MRSEGGGRHGEDRRRKTRRTIPSIFHDPEKVAAAVAQAKRTAQEKAVPLTLSRLADCLGVEGEELYTFLEGRGGGPAVPGGPPAAAPGAAGLPDRSCWKR